MRTTLGLLALLAALPGCQCPGTPLRPSAAEIRTAPESLDLGRTLVATTRESEFALSNRGARPVSLTLETASPFAVHEASLELAPGEDAIVRVEFRSDEVGRFAGAIQLAADGWTLRLPLAAEAVQCVADRPCSLASWDESTQSCVVEPAPDGSSCRTLCVVAAQCSGGECVGQPCDCDDLNACTADSCSEDAGCLNEGTSCPETPNEPCLAAACEPDAGCVVRSVEDGVSCTTACIEAGSCSAGQCFGTARDCSDQNACTADSCREDAGGCVHADVSASCPGPEQPCLTSVCLEDAGCGFALVADGTACRASTCSERFVCQRGTCAAVASPVLDAGCGCRDWSPPTRTFSAGYFHTCRVTASRRVECWGRNEHGQIGDGTTTSRASPTLVQGLVDVVQVAAASVHTCALVSDGGVSCWGRNQEESVSGAANHPNQLTPFHVPGLPAATAITAGWLTSCIRAVDGSAWCWGRGAEGQLGDGSLRNASSPVRVAVTGEVLEIQTRETANTLVLMADGRLLHWGAWDDGVSNVPTEYVTQPRSIRYPLEVGVQVLSRGQNWGGLCILSLAGTPYCGPWLQNDDRDGGISFHPELRPPGPGLPDLGCTSDLASGNLLMGFVRVDGTIRAWGHSGPYGMLGDGLSAPVGSPDPARFVDLSSALPPAREIHYGGRHVCAVLVDAGFRCWGSGDAGQLGDGAFNSRSTP